MYYINAVRWCPFLGRGNHFGEDDKRAILARPPPPRAPMPAADMYIPPPLEAAHQATRSGLVYTTGQGFGLPPGARPSGSGVCVRVCARARTCTCACTRSALRAQELSQMCVCTGVRACSCMGLASSCMGLAMLRVVCVRANTPMHTCKAWYTPPRALCTLALTGVERNRGGLGNATSHRRGASGAYA